MTKSSSRSGQKTGERQTVYGALRPLLEGTGDVATPHVAQPEPGLGLVVGDLLLAMAEDELSSQWPACLDRKPRAFRVLSALPRILHRGAAAKVDAQLDPGRRRTEPRGFQSCSPRDCGFGCGFRWLPDLYSLQGLRNLGPTLRRWQSEWEERRERNPVDGSSRSGRRDATHRLYRDAACRPFGPAGPRPTGAG